MGAIYHTPTRFSWGQKISFDQSPGAVKSTAGTCNFITSRQRVLGSVWGKRGTSDRSHSICRKIMVLKDHTVECTQTGAAAAADKDTQHIQTLALLVFFFLLQISQPSSVTDEYQGWMINCSVTTYKPPIILSQILTSYVKESYPFVCLLLLFQRRQTQFDDGGRPQWTSAFAKARRRMRMID